MLSSPPSPTATTSAQLDTACAMEVFRRRTLSRTIRPDAAEEPNAFPAMRPDDGLLTPSLAPAAPSVPGTDSRRYRPRLYLNTRVTRPSHLRTMSLATALGATPRNASKHEEETGLDEKAALQDHAAWDGTHRSSKPFPVQEHEAGFLPLEKPSSPIGRARTRTRKMSLAMSAAVRSASMHLRGDRTASFQISPPQSPVEAETRLHTTSVPVVPDATETLHLTAKPRISIADSTAAEVDVETPKTVGGKAAASDKHHETLKLAGDGKPLPTSEYVVVATKAENELPSVKAVSELPEGGIAFPSKEQVPVSADDRSGSNSQLPASKGNELGLHQTPSKMSSPPRSPHRFDSARPSMSASARRLRMWSTGSRGSHTPRHSLLGGQSMAVPTLRPEPGISATPIVGLQLGDIAAEFALPHGHHAGTSAVSAVASHEGKRRARLSSMASSDARSSLHSFEFHPNLPENSPGHPVPPLQDLSIGAAGPSLPIVRYHKKNTHFTMFRWGNAAEVESGELWFVDGRVLHYSIFGKTSVATPLLYLPDLLQPEPEAAAVPEPLRARLETVTQQLVMITTPHSIKTSPWPEPKELDALRLKLTIAQWVTVAATGTGIVPALDYVHTFPHAAKSVVAHDINLGHPGPHDLAAASISSGDAWNKLRTALSLPLIEEGNITTQEYHTVLHAAALQLQSVTDDTNPAMVSLARAWNMWQRAQGQILNASSDEVSPLTLSTYVCEPRTHKTNIRRIWSLPLTR